MRSNLVKLTILVMSIFMVTYVFAATVDVTGVEFIGGGEAEVTSPADVDEVNWVLTTPGEGWRQITGVIISFDGALSSSITIFVELLDSSEELVSEGNIILSRDLLADDSITTDVNPDIYPNVIVNIAIIVVS